MSLLMSPIRINVVTHQFTRLNLYIYPLTTKEPHNKREALVDTELFDQFASFLRIASIGEESTLAFDIKNFDANYDHKEYVEFLFCSEICLTLGL